MFFKRKRTSTSFCPG